MPLNKSDTINATPGINNSFNYSKQSFLIQNLIFGTTGCTFVERCIKTILHSRAFSGSYELVLYNSKCFKCAYLYWIVMD